MPKMRGFKSEIWTDEKFVELTPLGRLLFMGMWNYACDNGHLDDKPKQIKMRVLPTDDVDAAELIDHMIDLGMVRRDDVGLSVPKLRDHQRLDNRYFTWCDRCEDDEIPEPARSKRMGLTSPARREPDVSTTSARVVPSEGRKEGTEVDRKDDSAGKPAKRATQLPVDFRPSDKHQELAAEMGVDLRREWAKFTDHHRAKGSTFKDWSAALNNWIRKAAEFSGNVRPLRPEADEQGRVILPPLPKGVFEQ